MGLLHKMVVALTLAFAIPAVVVILVANRALEEVEQHATDEATRSLVALEEDQLERLASERAHAIEAILGPVAEDVRVLRAAWEDTTRTGLRVASAEVYPDPGVPWLPGYGRVHPRYGTYADYERRGPGSPWVPRFEMEAARRDPAIRRRLSGQLDRLMQLAPLLRDVTERRAGTLDLGWIVLANGPTTAWPPYDYATMLAEDPTLADVVEADEDYVRAVAPAEDPEGELRWLEPYFDRFKGLWMTSCVTPVYGDGAFEGAVGLDLLLPTVSREVLEVERDPHTSLFLVTATGRLVAAGPAAIETLGVSELHRAALRRTLLPADGATWDQDELDALHTSLADHPDPDVRGLVNAMRGADRLRRSLTLRDTEVLVAAERVPSTGWSLAVVKPMAEALAGVEVVRDAIQTKAAEARREFAGFAAIVLVVGAAMGVFLYSLTLRPLAAFTRRVEELDLEKLEFSAQDTRRTDEIGQLDQKLAHVIALIRGARDELTAARDAKERQVEERTAELRDRDVALRQLEEARSLLEEADRHKDQFLAMLGHELRNPLFAIRNAVWLLAKAEENPEQLQTLVGVLDRQSAHMSALVEGLLDVSRIARGKLELHREAVDLAEIVRRVVQDRSSQIAQRGLGLAIDAPAPLWVDGDDVRLTQVFANLVANAIKFTPPGGRLTVSAKREGPEVVVRVRDTGVGIDPAMRPHLFEAFRQGPQDLDRSEGGLGLGLALSKGIVELHGGHIEAQSEGRGQGSEFVVRLPPGPARTAPAPEPARPRVSPERVLVVEDNEDTARLLVQVLERAGHEVLFARSGREALDRVRGDHPTVVLCDLGLPETSGFEVARAIRADPELRDIWLVALTGYGQAEDVRRSREAGFDTHLTKPVDPEVIESTLGRRAA